MKPHPSHRPYGQAEAPGFPVDHHDFPTRVLAASHERAVLIDFWAGWCAPCVHLAPILDRVVVEYRDRILFAKVEVDQGENMRLAGHYRLKGFPTVMLFRDGEEVARFVGAKPLQFVRHFVADHV
jgi:putative thioredoxin